MCVCVRVRLCVYRVCVSIMCSHASVCVCVSVCVPARVYACVATRAHARACVYLCVCARAGVRVCGYTCTRAYLCVCVLLVPVCVRACVCVWCVPPVCALYGANNLHYQCCQKLILEVSQGYNSIRLTTQSAHCIIMF